MVVVVVAVAVAVFLFRCFRVGLGDRLGIRNSVFDAKDLGDKLMG